MKSKTLEKFGTILGIAPGNVPCYSSDYKSVDESLLPTRHTYRNYIDGIFMGHKWQCVEFARRWLYLNKGYIFDDVAVAFDIFELQMVRVIKDQSSLPLYSFKNGSKRPPEPGCMIIWDDGGDFEHTGHVAIVTEVLDGRIRIVEQNYDQQFWPEFSHYSRELRTNVDINGGHWVECTHCDNKLIGWVIQTDHSLHSVTFPPIKKELLVINKCHVPRNGQANSMWLNVANPDEAAYVDAYGITVNDRKIDPYVYYTISETAEKEIKKATNELHGMFMHATDYILKHENLLEKFCFPKAIWPRLQRSWENRRNQMITGRFDFSMTQDGIKVYEYNADSSSTHMECAKIQNRWSHHFGCREGKCAGERLHKNLVEAWKASEVDGTLHILQDHDHEETYHALFMKSAMEQAGITCKVIKGIDSLKKVGESILDFDGQKVNWVWKTWAWETAMDQINDYCLKPDHCDLKLVDVLLGANVLVYEPLWTLIPSNKAILAILWDLYPGHPYLLETSFVLPNRPKSSGYVMKPIVGRCGSNISIIGPDGKMVESTEGKFGSKEVIYQEYFTLPKVDSNYVQISSFSVSGFYSGCNVRINPSPIVVSGSDLPTLRIVDDQKFLS